MRAPDGRGLYISMSRGRERDTVYVVTEHAHAADLRRT